MQQKLNAAKLKIKKFLTPLRINNETITSEKNQLKFLIHLKKYVNKRKIP